jgi:hypothetical protein
VPGSDGAEHAEEGGELMASVPPITMVTVTRKNIVDAFDEWDRQDTEAGGFPPVPEGESYGEACADYFIELLGLQQKGPSTVDFGKEAG